MTRAIELLLFVALFLALFTLDAQAATWYVRNDGGTTVQCTGQANAAYAGGTGQPCAYSGLQNAINNSAAGDFISLKAGDTFVGTFSLPVKAGASYITIHSSLIGNLPAGVRVGPGDAANMATIRTNVPNGPAFFTSGVTHHFRFQGLEMLPSSGVACDTMVLFGSNPKETSLAQITHDFDIDRCYIHGLTNEDNHHGIVANSQYTTIRESYISDWHGIGIDTQAILIFNSPGNISITNNYLEGAGENILIGGSDPGITNLVPSNIVIERNFVFKPLSWKVGDPSYAGNHWTVKNLLELKNAQDITINGNVFQNCWVDGQTGIPILFTVRNQDHNAPWSIVQRITFTNNTIRDTLGAFNLLGFDNEAASQQSTDLLIQNNLIGPNVINEPFLTFNRFYNVTINHNTHFQSNNITILYAAPSTGFMYENNITIWHLYGVFGEGGIPEGTAALDVWTPGYTFTKNVVVNAPGGYPTGNFYPASVATVDFVNYNGGDCITGNCSLNVTSPYHLAATDGTDIGYDRAALLAAQGGVTGSNGKGKAYGKTKIHGKASLQ